MGKAKTLLAMVLLLVAGLGTWYRVDRPSMLHSVCTLGLPNFSIPSELDPDEVGCAILAPRGRYIGLLTTGSEASNFSSSDFPKVPSDSGFGDSRSWFNCPKEGCPGDLVAQLHRNILQECIEDPSFRMGLATVVAEGWVTVSQGTFGHLNSYPREFFASRIVSFTPPPEKVIAERLDAFRRRGMCD